MSTHEFEKYRDRDTNKRVTFSSMDTLFYCNAELFDNLAKMDIIKESQKISDLLIDEMCMLLEQFHITEVVDSGAWW